MRAILISIKPKYVADILNGKKTIEIRKKFPSDYVGWVYIYVTKGKPVLYFNNRKSFVDIGEQLPIINGKVVARFWCDKVIDLFCYTDDLLKQACLTEDELLDYLQGKNGCAIHIIKLKIFDEPKEISEFITVGKKCKFENDPIEKEWWCEWCKKADCIGHELTRAPQSWCYVEDSL